MHNQSIGEQIKNLSQTERRVLDQIATGNTFKDISRYAVEIPKRLKALEKKGLAIEDLGQWTMAVNVHLAWCQLCSEPTVVNPSSRGDRWLVVRFPDGSWSTGGSPSNYGDGEAELFWVHETTRERALPKAQAWRSRELGLIKKEFGDRIADRCLA
ncbi:hypothetical protein S7335_1150 [Synechococcus sp. PCC 7335]|uniref:hypothetical protein n=1 Tax=Synechococcus sp. (strain ATCC 29403 / PCC 7335) TaxID=91464 RepID=UPI00017EB56F|nr:hypothetical protein [Synechococcus sp. PCC 7335]EDX82446.1 hypothetical protein S7335_1150 [Synechococcus sp. PCC 7335]